jgi:hypothetical protein
LAPFLTEFRFYICEQQTDLNYQTDLPRVEERNEKTIDCSNSDLRHDLDHGGLVGTICARPQQPKVFGEL